MHKNLKKKNAYKKVDNEQTRQTRIISDKYISTAQKSRYLL